MTRESDTNRDDNQYQVQQKILILVVLYKCSFFESETIKSILTQNIDITNLQLVIWDNSPSPAPFTDQIELKSKISFDYISRKENVPLSKVYNEVVSTYNFEYLLLLDQDTGIPPNYLDEVISHVNKYPEISLFLPTVKNGNLIVSPGNFHFFKGKHWKNTRTGLIDSKNILAVTSGMLISNAYFIAHKYRFDERLNLYGIDSKFMLEYAKNEKYVQILPVTFSHNSALWSKPSADVLLPRFLNLKKAWTIILSDRPMAKFLYAIYSKYLSIKLAIRYGDTRFL